MSQPKNRPNRVKRFHDRANGNEVKLSHQLKQEVIDVVPQPDHLQIKYSPENITIFLNAIANGVPEQYARSLIDISDQTLRRWKEEHVGLCDLIAKAKAEHVNYHVNNIKAHAQDDWKASQFLLSKADRDYFGDKPAETHQQEVILQLDANALAKLKEGWQEFQKNKQKILDIDVKPVDGESHDHS